MIRRSKQASARTRTLASLAATLLVAIAPAHAGVFSGDPIDADTGQPWFLQPGAPLVHPGDDERYGDGDDVFDDSLAGDVDLVLRSGGTFAGGAFPPPAAGVALAPLVRAGGDSLGGSEVAFDVVVSDGAASPAAGNPLTGPELNGRGALVFAFADLDGDGFLGPTDTDGDADNEIERQEVLTPIGRQVAVFLAGVASGGLGVSLGAPSSAGGLAVVLVAGAFTGGAPPLFDDGTWITTLLPFVPSTDPGRILGGNARPPDPEYLAAVELELDSDRHWVPRGSHPAIGTPFAIPLDGSSVSVDLARAVAGTAVGAGLGVAVDVNVYQATPGRRLLPALDGAGATRVLVEPSAQLALADDGPGNSATVLVYAADLLGNPADPAATMAIELQAGPALRIAAPDVDGDPSVETISLASAASVAIELDDAGVANDSSAFDRLVATVDGVPTAAIDASVGSGAAPTSWSSARAMVQLGARPEVGGLRVTATFSAAPGSIDPQRDGLTITVSQGIRILYTRTFPAGSFTIGGAAARRFSFRDPVSSPTARVRNLVLDRRPSTSSTHRLQLTVRPLDLSSADDGPLTLTFQSGASTVTAPLPCSSNARATLMRCALP